MVDEELTAASEPHRCRQYMQPSKRHCSELSLRNSYSDCTGPPPYNRAPELCCSRRSCQELNSAKRYMLLALGHSGSNGNLCNSYPSEKFERAIVRRSLRNFGPRHAKSKDLQEVVVHKLEDKPRTPRNRRSYEHAQLRELGQSGSAVGSSSESDSNSEQRQLLKQQEQQPTSV